tara:strand:- start:512 stop:685 length:174 start_codon:yes stop_codon:yes gene_type:complete
MKLKSTASKLSIGIKAIRFNIKSKKGKRAIKKLKEMLPALEDRAPLTIPEMYISRRS